MENMEYANAYTEVIEILKYISEADYNKIPKNKINLFETNANKEYKFIYNPNLTLNEQNVSKRAKAIIAILFREYWATEKQREKIIAKQNNDRMQIEKNKKERYNPDNLFYRRTKRVENIQNETVSLTEYKETFFSKILKRIKKIVRG